MEKILKYPRTQHVQGSRLQKGDEDLEQVPLSSLYGKYLVVEEKLDAANCGVSFDSGANLRLQSRGHYLNGGPRERQFDYFKRWAADFEDQLFFYLEDRYIMYAEFLHKKHTIWYNLLPGYIMEFDIYDKQIEKFLSTAVRKRILFETTGMLWQAPVLWSGTWTKDMDFRDLIGLCGFKSLNWKQEFEKQIREKNPEQFDLIMKTTDMSDQMEGLYIKWEEDGEVKGRYKFVRPDFVSMITGNGIHHIDLPFVENKLR